MTIQLVEGQSFANDYILLHSLGSDEALEVWLALDEKIQQRVRLKVFVSPFDQVSRENLRASFQQQKGLLHPNILRTYAVQQNQGQDYIACQYVQNARKFEFEPDLKRNWEVLKPIVLALEYAHSLGFTHAAISPENILISADGHAYLDNFGFSQFIKIRQAQYQSPEVRQGHIPDMTDDIYSVAQLFFRALTGKIYEPGQALESDQPVPESIRDLLLAMLESNRAARPRDFQSLIQLLDAYTSDKNKTDSLAAEPFQRVGQATQAVVPATHKLPRDRSVVSTSTALIGLVLLIGFATALFLLLPTSTPDPKTQPLAKQATSSPVEQAGNKTEPEQDTPAPLEQAKLDQLKLDGKKLAEALLRGQIDLEDMGGRLWAKDRYDQSAALGLAGDEAYREEKLQLAVDNYQQGIDLVNSAITDVEKVFNENQLKGEDALQTGDAPAAIDAYSILTVIKPNDSQLQAGLTRAQNLDSVKQLVSNGEINERNRDLTSALQAYKQAVNLDPKWQPAQQALSRVQRAITSGKFDDQMSAGFAALANNDFNRARDAFSAAQKLMPNSTEPEDGIQQVSIKEIQQQTDNLTEQANNLMTQGQWAEAIAKLEAILALLPGSLKTEKALEKANSRLVLDQALNKYIQQPQLMRDDSELEKAKSALIEGASIDQPEAFLKEQLSQLSQLISLARIKVSVELTSDNRTDVTVYRVGEFGKITSQQLSLYPGVYTFVGKRSGYRDVYQEVTIKGDASLVSVHISCEEKI